MRGFISAAQVEFVVMTMGVFIPLQRQSGFRVSGILFRNMLSPAIVGKTRKFFVERTALLREEVGRTVSDPAEIDEEIHALCDALLPPKDD